MSKKELQKKLDNINKQIDIEVNNLIYLLNNMNIEDINLLNIHFKLIDLLNKRDMLNNKLFYDK